MQLAHKTDAGAVRLDISDSDQLCEGYEGMLRSVRERSPQVQIDGVLVQPMVRDGIEVIVGVHHDAQFGPVLMLGLGGTLVEVLEAISHRLCPIGENQANAMISEVKGLSRLLAGYRGGPKADSQALVDTLVRVSLMAVWAKEEISSLDINPLAVLPAGCGVVALDALIIPQ